MSSIARKDLWQTRIANLADQQRQPGSSHPGIFNSQAGRGPQPRLASSRSSPVLPYHKWAPQSGTPSPTSSGLPTPVYLGNALLTPSVKPPSTCSSTELPPSPEGSIRQVSTPSDCSADEGGSRSPSVGVVTPEITETGPPTWATGGSPRPWGVGAPRPGRASAVASADYGCRVAAARAAAATAKSLTGALSTELRDLESEMEDLTHELLAIRAAVPGPPLGRPHWPDGLVET